METGIKAKTEQLTGLQSALGKTNSEMAKLIGCTRKTYQSAINGENVSAGFMARVTLAFNVPFDRYFCIASEQAA